MIVSETEQDTYTISNHYDELDPFYRALWGEDLHHGLWEEGVESPEQAVDRLTNLVAKSAALKPGMKVCDIGCGYGGTSRKIAQDFDVQVTAITLSNVQYQYAINNTRGQPIQYILGDWMHNHLSDKSFDATIAIESSEHMTDKFRFFQECYRVLKPAGKVVVAAWLAKNQPNALETKFLLEPICSEGRMPSLGSTEDYMRWMQAAGFQNIRFHDITSQVKKTWTICCKRAFIAFFNQAHFRQYLLNPNTNNRVFFKTIFRIWLAYQLGSMQYGIFVGSK